MNGIRRRVAALAAALSLAVLVPAAVPAGAAAIVPGGGVIYGSVIGQDHGTLMGGTVTACLVYGGCWRATIDSQQTYRFDDLPGGAFTIGVTPPSYGARYVPGWYAAWSPGNFTASYGNATLVYAAPQKILPPIVVPVRAPTLGSITGRVLASTGAPLTGGSVMACGLTAGCWSVAIGWDGLYALGGLLPDRYRISISPPPNTAYPSGWYSAWAPGSFTTNPGAATLVWVGAGNVALPTIIVPAPVLLRGSISGSVIGSDGGSLAGATVTACPPIGPCTARTVAWDGTYLLPNLAPANYLVSIAPAPGAPYLAGFYSSFSAGYFNPVLANASAVPVAYVNVALPRIVVPRFLVVGGPAATPAAPATPSGPAAGTTAARPLALTSWIRPAATTQVRSMVSVPAGAKVELVARTETYYVGRSVEVWRRVDGGAWARVATRTVAADGRVVYRFTARDDAAYRLRMPATATALEAVGLVRRVRVR
ncbi:MAG: carboxypeptidase-like regulatory domain-containing protein [Chloroflexi bacterium]|nr:carboxypeptidase-like regulatory domain-containing protein [Chloroflexota bacterium]